MLLWEPVVVGSSRTVDGGDISFFFFETLKGGWHWLGL